MANKKLYRENVLQMLFADSDSEAQWCRRARRECSRSTNKWSFDPLPNGDGGGKGEHPFNIFNIYYFLNITDELIKN